MQRVRFATPLVTETREIHEAPEPTWCQRVMQVFGCHALFDVMTRLDA